MALERGEGSESRPGHSLPSGKDSVPIVQEAGWASGPVWTGAENLAPTGIRSPELPTRSQSLYRLSYPAQLVYNEVYVFRGKPFQAYSLEQNYYLTQPFEQEKCNTKSKIYL